MVNSNRNILSSKQLIFVIIGTQIGTGIFHMARVISFAAKQDAWICVLLGAVFPLISLLIINAVVKKLPSLNIAELAWSVFGKIIGSFMVTVFIIYGIFFISVLVRIFSELINIRYLPLTPLPVIAFLFILTMLYIVNKGLTVLGRLNELLFYVGVFLILLVIMPIFADGQITNLMPVGEVGMKELFLGTWSTGLYFSGVEVLLIFYSYINRQDEVLKVGITAAIITTFTYLIIVIACISVYGADGVQRIIWPLIFLLKTRDYPVISSLDFFFMTLWMGIGIRPIINLGSAVFYSGIELLKIKQEKHSLYNYFHSFIISAQFVPGF
jgi:spore germination protein